LKFGELKFGELKFGELKFFPLFGELKFGELKFGEFKFGELKRHRGVDRVLSRRDVIGVLEEVFGSDKSKILSIGELQPRRWEVVLADDSAVSTIIRKSSVTFRGKMVRFEVLRRQPRRLRVKRVPSCIPHEYVAELLARYRIKVMNITFERDPDDGIATNTRLALINADDWELVPDVLPWSFDGLRGSALLFLAGRPPCCHRCHDRGHQVKDCPVPYCRVCRRTGHVSSEECHNRRETYAERVAASATMNADDDADHDDGMQDGQLLESGTQSWSEMAEQQSSEMMPTDPPVCAGDSMPVISAEYSSDDDDQQGKQGDVESDTTDTQVELDADGFRRPTDHIRRQQRAKKRFAKKSPTSSESMPRKMSATTMEETNEPSTAVPPDVTAAVAASACCEDSRPRLPASPTAEELRIKLAGRLCLEAVA